MPDGVYDDATDVDADNDDAERNMMMEKTYTNKHRGRNKHRARDKCGHRGIYNKAQ